MRTLYQQLKKKGISVLTVVDKLNKAEILNSKGTKFPQRTVQSFFDKEFQSNNETTQEDMNKV